MHVAVDINAEVHTMMMHTMNYVVAGLLDCPFHSGHILFAWLYLDILLPSPMDKIDP